MDGEVISGLVRGVKEKMESLPVGGDYMSGAE